MRNRNSYFKRSVIAIAIIAAVVAGSPGVQSTVHAATAATDGVLIRNDASTDAGIIGSLDEGDEVEILDVVQSGDGYNWYYIEMDNGNTGYARSDLINASEEELAAFNVEEVSDAHEYSADCPAQQSETGILTENEDVSDEEEKPKKPGNYINHYEKDTVTHHGEGYDATKDPDANFVTRFETEADGTGSWYVYNEDNGSRIKISDLSYRENSEAELVARGPDIWKTFAITFGISTLILAAILIKNRRKEN